MFMLILIHDMMQYTVFLTSYCRQIKTLSLFKLFSKTDLIKTLRLIYVMVERSNLNIQIPPPVVRSYLRHLAPWPLFCLQIQKILLSIKCFLFQARTLSCWLESEISKEPYLGPSKPWSNTLRQQCKPSIWEKYQSII